MTARPTPGGRRCVILLDRVTTVEPVELRLRPGRHIDVVAGLEVPARTT